VGGEFGRIVGFFAAFSFVPIRAAFWLSLFLNAFEEAALSDGLAKLVNHLAPKLRTFGAQAPAT
jgi:hypothetical protein